GGRRPREDVAAAVRGVRALLDALYQLVELVRDRLAGVRVRRVGGALRRELVGAVDRLGDRVERLLGGLLPALRVLDVALVLLRPVERRAQRERPRRVERVIRRPRDLL